MTIEELLKITHPLTEAEYGLDENDDIIEDASTETSTEDEATTDAATSEGADTETTPDEIENDPIATAEGEEATDEVSDDGSDIMGDSTEEDTTEEETDKNAIKILDVSKEQEQNINQSISMYLKSLRSNIDQSMKRLGNLTTSDNNQSKIHSFAANELCDLSNEIEIYLKVTFSKSPEENMKNYMTYLKNYRGIIKVIAEANAVRQKQEDK